ncbi:MAG: hypothetical protein IAG13_17410 [Deltaproteobacteria bacterium]|nr:hypothetical protein [Nannocystaceae bacterium]
MSRRVLLITLPLACSSFELTPIEIDVSSNCNRVGVSELVAEIDGPARPWDRVVAMAVDAPGLASGWLLVIRHDDGGPDELGLVYLGADGTVLVEHSLAEPPALAGSFELVPSTEPGVAWLSHGQVGSFTLWRLDAGAVQPVLASQNLAPNPYFCDPDHDGTPEPCDSWQWPHRVVFVGQRMYLLGVPPSSPDAQVDIWLTAIEWPRELESPQLRSDVVLHFTPDCDLEDIEDSQVCEALLAEHSYPRIEPVALLRDARAAHSELALYRELDDGSGLLLLDIALVVLSPGESGVGGDLLAPPGLSPPRDAGARGVAQDVFSSYLHFIAQDGTAVLAQRPPGLDDDEPFVQLEREGLALTLEHELAQLDDDIVLHRVQGGAWELLKVFPDAPERSQVTLYQRAAAVISAEPAGPSSFLVRSEGGRTDLVRVTCDAGDETGSTGETDA